MSVKIEDVAALLGQEAPAPGSPKAEQWALWIEQAYNLIRWRFGEAYDDLDPDLVDYVVLESVARHIRSWRPENVRRRDVSVDDGRVAYDYYESVGSLGIPDDLWPILDPETGSGVFSTRLSGEPGYGGVPCWWTTTDGGGCQ